MVYGGCFHFSFLNNFVWIQQIDCKYWYLQFCSNSKTDVDCEIVFMTANSIFTKLSCTRNGRPFWVLLLIRQRGGSSRRAALSFVSFAAFIQRSCNPNHYFRSQCCPTTSPDLAPGPLFLAVCSPLAAAVRGALTVHRVHRSLRHAPGGARPGNGLTAGEKSD